MTIDIFNEFAREMWDLQRHSLEPLASTSETDDEVIVEVDLPLVKKDDIALRLIEEGLEIEASLTRCVRFERWGTVQRSCEFRSFYKIVPLPSPVVPDGTTATFKKGILRINLKKKKEIEYRIPIR